MSYEANITTTQQQIQQQAQKQSLGKELGSSLAMSAVMTGGFGSVSSVARNGGPIKALKTTQGYNKVLNEYAKQQTCDTFTKNLKTAQNYDEYKRLAKEAQKLGKKVDKLNKKSKLPLFEHIKNIFRKNPIKDIDELKNIAETNSKTALDNLDNAKNLLKKGEDIANGAKILAKNKGFLQNTKTLFKQELTNPLVIVITALSTLPRITEEVIPTFQNEGVIAGIKTTGKVLSKAVLDFFSNAGFSAIGRGIGTIAGSLFGPVGTTIGGTVGDIVGSFFSNKIITGIFKKDNKNTNEQLANAVSSNTADTINTNTMNLTDSAVQQNTAGENLQSSTQTAPESSDTNETKVSDYTPNKYSGMTSRYQGARKTNREFLA